jgi:hypothetical protein
MTKATCKTTQKGKTILQKIERVKAKRIPKDPFQQR